MVRYGGESYAYALCPMPYALCPMPASAPHVSEKGYTTYLQEKSIISINYVEQDLRKYAGSVLVPSVES